MSDNLPDQPADLIEVTCPNCLRDSREPVARIRRENLITCFWCDHQFRPGSLELLDASMTALNGLSKAIGQLSRALDEIPGGLLQLFDGQSQPDNRLEIVEEIASDDDPLASGDVP